jgi:hypothetical protein
MTVGLNKTRNLSGNTISVGYGGFVIFFTFLLGSVNVWIRQDRVGM